MRSIDDIIKARKNIAKTNVAYLNDKGEIVKKEQATQCIITEYDKDGNIINEIFTVLEKEHEKEIEEEERKDAKKAVLQYRIIENTSFSAFDFINEAERESLCLVDITLITGRHHQIRVQFSHIGCPIWGDAKYNPDWNEKKNIGKIGLCAYELTFFHPITKQQMTVRY